MVPLTLRDGGGDDRGDQTQLCVLGPVSLVVRGDSVDLSPVAGRIFALLALLGDGGHRSRVAGTLWPEQPEGRALSNLRAAVWRLPEGAAELIAKRGSALVLAPRVRVDLHHADRLARRILAGDLGPLVSADDRELLTRDLVPMCDDEWLVVPREQHRQRRLHALEALAAHELDCGRPLDSVDTALAAVSAEPLRESAHLLVVRAHLAAGNRAAAADHYERFASTLWGELGVEPSATMVDLLHRGMGTELADR